MRAFHWQAPQPGQGCPQTRTPTFGGHPDPVEVAGELFGHVGLAPRGQPDHHDQRRGVGHVGSPCCNKKPKKKQQTPNTPQNSIRGAAEHKARPSAASPRVPVDEAPPRIPGRARGVSLSLMSSRDHSGVSQVFANEADRQHRCLMGLLVLKAFAARPGAVKGERKMFLTKRSRSLSKQPEQAPKRPAERRIWGEKHGMGMGAAAGRLGAGERREGTAGQGQDGDPREGREARGRRAQPSPPPRCGSRFCRARGAHPAPHRRAGATHSTASRRPCPAGPRRSPAAPPTWLRAAAPRPAVCKSHANDRRSSHTAERGRKPGPGDRTRGKRGAAGRENGPASRARGRAVCK